MRFLSIIIAPLRMSSRRRRSLLLTLFLLAGLATATLLGTGAGSHLLAVHATGVGRGGESSVSTTVAIDWQQPGFDAGHSGLNPDETVLSPTNAGSLVSLWHFKQRHTAYSIDPATAGSLLYANTDTGTLLALDADTGNLVWSYTSGALRLSAPVVATGLVFIGVNGTLTALDEATGSLVWSDAGMAGDVPPTDANGVLYSVSGTGLWALNAATGASLWNNMAIGTISSPPAVAGSVLYVGANGKLSALDTATGALLWSRGIGGCSACAPGVIASGGSVLLAETGNVLYAVDPNTHKPMWHYNAGQGMTLPAVAFGVVYANTYHRLVALDAATGALLWTFDKGTINTRHAHFTSLAAPVLAGGVIYVDISNAACDTLIAVDGADGTRLWKYFKTNAQPAYPIIVNGQLYVGSDQVYAFGLPAAS